MINQEVYKRAGEVLRICVVCKKGLWENLSYQEKIDIAESTQAAIDILHVPIYPQPICKKCLAKSEEMQREEQVKSDVRRLITEGILPECIYQYREPYPAFKSASYGILLAAEEWNLDRNLWICGPEGTGKTSLARYLLVKNLINGKTVREASAYEIQIEGNKFEPDWKKYTLHRVLLIDDIANVTWNMKGFDLLRAILTVRHEKQFPTIVTSNVTESEFHRMIAEQATQPEYATSLMRRFRPYLLLKIDGESLRKQLNEWKGK